MHNASHGHGWLWVVFMWERGSTTRKTTKLLSCANHRFNDKKMESCNLLQKSFHCCLSRFEISYPGTRVVSYNHGERPTLFCPIFRIAEMQHQPDIEIAEWNFIHVFQTSSLFAILLRAEKMGGMEWVFDNVRLECELLLLSVEQNCPMLWKRCHAWKELYDDMIIIVIS